MTELLLIAGVQKAATTSLFHVLAAHPQVAASRIKEPQYFAFRAPPRYAGPGDEAFGASIVTTERDYAALWSDSGPCSYRMEASTFYSIIPMAPSRIGCEAPGARVILVLRDPIERAYSAFMHMRRDMREPLVDFMAALDAEEDRRLAGWSPSFWYQCVSRYAVQLERFLASVAPGRVHVVLYEELVSDPGRATRSIAEWLGLGPFEFPPLMRHNPSGEVSSSLARRLLFTSSPLRSRLRQILPRAAHTAVVRMRNGVVAKDCVPGAAVAAMAPDARVDARAVARVIGRPDLPDLWPTTFGATRT